MVNDGKFGQVTVNMAKKNKKLKTKVFIYK